jgi:hypothetical protein
LFTDIVKLSVNGFGDTVKADEVDTDPVVEGAVDIAVPPAVNWNQLKFHEPVRDDTLIV